MELFVNCVSSAEVAGILLASITVLEERCCSQARECNRVISLFSFKIGAITSMEIMW